MAKSYTQIQAIKTADKILRFISKSPSPVTGSEIAEAIEISHGTVMSQVSTMLDIGWLTEVGGRYEIGTGIMTFWARQKAELTTQFRSKFDDLMNLMGG